MVPWSYCTWGSKPFVVVIMAIGSIEAVKVDFPTVASMPQVTKKTTAIAMPNKMRMGGLHLAFPASLQSRLTLFSIEWGGCVIDHKNNDLQCDHRSATSYLTPGSGHSTVQLRLPKSGHGAHQSKGDACLQAYAYLEVASGSIPLFLIVS